MKKFTKIKEEKKEFKYEYGCVMMYFDIPNWKDILKMIDKEDIYDVKGYGLEKDPHITLLFGLLQQIEEEDVKNVLLGIPKPLIELKNINIFNCDGYDVVKIDIENVFLNDINVNLSTNLPNEQTFPDYHPHMTISYVKPGRGVKYIGKLDNTIVVKPTKIIYSKPNKNGKDKKIDLNIWETS